MSYGWFTIPCPTAPCLSHIPHPLTLGIAASPQHRAIFCLFTLLSLSSNPFSKPNVFLFPAFVYFSFSLLFYFQSFIFIILFLLYFLFISGYICCFISTSVFLCHNTPNLFHLHLPILYLFLLLIFLIPILYLFYIFGIVSLCIFS